MERQSNPQCCYSYYTFTGSSKPQQQLIMKTKVLSCIKS